MDVRRCVTLLPWGPRSLLARGGLSLCEMDFDAPCPLGWSLRDDGAMCIARRWLRHAVFVCICDAPMVARVLRCADGSAFFCLLFSCLFTWFLLFRRLILGLGEPRTIAPHVPCAIAPRGPLQRHSSTVH